MSAGRTAPRRHRIAVVRGDGVGREVVLAGLRVLRAAAERDGGFILELEELDWGSERYLRVGRMMPEDAVEVVRGFDAV